MSSSSLERMPERKAESEFPEVTCEKYVRGYDGRVCRHYVRNGACARPDMFMCSQWLKVYDPPPLRDLLGYPVVEPPRRLVKVTTKAKKKAAGGRTRRR